MKACLLIALACFVPAWFAMHARAEESKRARAAAAKQPARLFDPSILLLRDDAARDEIGLSAEVRSKLDTTLARNNRALLAIRDVGPGGADESVIAAVQQVRDEVHQLLGVEQRQRLQGLILQAQGYDALGREDVARQLKLTAEQRTQLADAAAEFQQRSQEVAAGEGQVSEARNQALAKLQSERQQNVLEILDDKQTQQWATALGEPFDFTRVRPSPAAAPEFDDPAFASADAWLNSPPLTMKSLRGRVVVVHFFAFGCSNCINNYPWYREWHDAVADKPVTIIGVHTPETDAERDPAQLRASLEKHGLEFPVVIDNGKHAWTAWYNRVWPSVYLVDRRGNVRYWWYGELDWKGAGGQKIARQRIEQLLHEK